MVSRFNNSPRLGYPRGFPSKMGRGELGSIFVELEARSVDVYRASLNLAREFIR